jgi:enamine deaminase RidA (YjgF/YER057c/UK114 family)
MMTKTVINPPEMAPPTGYSYAIKKSGTPVFISGQVALDGAGRVVGENDAAAQVEQVFRNLSIVAQACGGSLDDIVKINIYVTDASYRPAVAAARERHFKAGQYPASTYVVVAALAVPQLLVEIEAVAMIG